MDIRGNVIELDALTEWNDINERYTLSGLVIKNFEENDVLGLRVQKVFWGALEFAKMQ